MIDRYEQAIKETFKYLEECIASQPKKGNLEYLYNLGIDKRYVIEKQMNIRGFEVQCDSNYDMSKIIIYPIEYNLPIHIWHDKSCIR